MTELPVIKIKNIIDKCNSLSQKKNLHKRGDDLNTEIGVQLTMNKVIQKKTIETASKISMFAHNLPKILRTVFEEDNNRMIEQSKDEVKVLKQYQNRRLNMQYNMIIESAAKTQMKQTLNKQKSKRE